MDIYAGRRNRVLHHLLIWDIFPGGDHSVATRADSKEKSGRESGLKLLKKADL